MCTALLNIIAERVLFACLTFVSINVNDNTTKSHPMKVYIESIKYSSNLVTCAFMVNSKYYFGNQYVCNLYSLLAVTVAVFVPKPNSQF